MTAEVAILNQYAVALAADSATTVSNWNGEELQVRYFKGANKLFQLSDWEPVGFMINGSAALHGIPWEILVKEFRKVLGKDAVDHLAGYSDRFFEFVRSHQGLFPQEARRKPTEDDSFRRAFFFAHDLRREIAEKALTGNAIREFVIAELAKGEAEIRAKNPTAPMTNAIADAAIPKYTVVVAKSVGDFWNVVAPGCDDLLPQLATIGILNAVKDFKTDRGCSGIVLAGYGSRDFFPSLDAHECWGYVDETLVVLKQDESCTIDADTKAAIEPFATTSMINTFRMGLSYDVFDGIHAFTQKMLASFAEKIAATLGFTGQINDLEGIIKQATTDQRRELVKHCRERHHLPLVTVIGSLPISDMAALAKSLVELESLKEKVTQSSESVAGPIDVAVISKHDGFVWIERKHYFNPELNARFFDRKRG